MPFHKKDPIPVNVLSRLVEYDPKTGKFTWKWRAVDDLTKWQAAARYNARFAGRPAFATMSTTGYWKTQILRLNVFAHRAAWALHYGTWPDGDIDHINGDRSDNRIENLRVVSCQENSRNMGLSRTNKSGRQGVHFSSRDRLWTAKIGIDGATKNLGSFKTKDEAVAAREMAEAEHGFIQSNRRSA